MGWRSIYLVACCIFLSFGVSAQSKADIIIFNGKVTTLEERQPEVQAVAIKSNKIIFTGTNSQALKLRGSKTVVIDELPRHNGINEIDYHVQGGGENLVADAADFENFLFPRPELPASLGQNLEPVIELLVRKRWPFRLHATYNESISRFLNVVEKVNRQTPLNGLPWFFDHAETVSVENLQRIKSLGGGIAIQHRMAYQGESFIHRYGKKAAAEAPPIKKMLERGIPVGIGTDGTRVASYNPWVALYWITTGKTIGGAQVIARENIIDRMTALRLFTSGGYALIKETEKGKIQKGYYADLVMLDKDYFNIEDKEIKSIVSKLTIVDGRIVYGDDDYRSYAPAALQVIPEWSPVKYFGGYQH